MMRLLIMRSWCETSWIKIFPDRWIGRRGQIEYPPRLPDLTPLNLGTFGLYENRRRYRWTQETFIEEDSTDKIRKVFKMFRIISLFSYLIVSLLMINNSRIWFEFSHLLECIDTIEKRIKRPSKWCVAATTCSC